MQGLPVGPLASNSVALQIALAVRALGIAALSSRVARPYVEQGRLERVLPDWSLPTMTVWCVTAGRRLLPARTTAFIEMLRGALAMPAAAGKATPAFDGNAGKS